MAVKQKIQKLLQELNVGIYEKEEIMALSLLSAIAGESIFMLGPPGVAKSLIARRLKYAFKRGKSFEYLMSRFSTPDEIFGPVSISKLKDKDKYERVTEHYLPKADVVFLDEIWKAGPSIQNALLTVINEKKYRNGEREIDVPMKALISASNELPAKNEGLEALWDRFLLRLIVEGIQEKDNFNAMISEKLDLYKDTVSAETKITNENFKKWANAINEIKIPENVFNLIDVIRKKLQLHNNNENNKDNQINISDRRWRKIVHLLRTSAFLNDRKDVDLMDCFLIKDCLWNEVGQIETTKQIVNDTIRDYGPDIDLALHTELEQFEKLTKEVEQNTSKINNELVIKNDPKGIGHYKLVQNYQDKYSLIPCDVVDNVGESGTRAHIYLEDFKDHEGIIIKKAEKKHCLNIIDNNSSYSHSFDTYQLETTPIIKPYQKSPSRGDYEIWNKETEALSSILYEKKEEAALFWDTFSESFYKNLFINKEKADMCIKSKIDDVIKDIDKFLININKLRNNYQHIYIPQ